MAMKENGALTVRAHVVNGQENRFGRCMMQLTLFGFWALFNLFNFGCWLQL